MLSVLTGELVSFCFYALIGFIIGYALAWLETRYTKVEQGKYKKSAWERFCDCFDWK